MSAYVKMTLDFLKQHQFEGERKRAYIERRKNELIEKIDQADNNEELQLQIYYILKEFEETFNEK